MGRELSELASYMLPLAVELFSKAKAAGLDPVIIDTGRTSAEQAQKLIQGVSWTQNSKHEPQPPEMKSEAIDIAPRAVMTQKNWAPSSPLWDQLGAIGKSLGLEWGGDWIDVNGKDERDPSHFQYIHRAQPIDPELTV